jgi:transketolase
VVPEDVAAYYRDASARASSKHTAWKELFAAYVCFWFLCFSLLLTLSPISRYQAAYPAEAAEFTRTQHGELPADWESKVFFGMVVFLFVLVGVLFINC